MLVVDASVAVRACRVEAGFTSFRGEKLVSPPLMWSEALAALHEAAWRGEIARADADVTRSRLERCSVERREHERLGEEAWRVADAFGWAKTYDAEYVALAQLLGCRLVTLDARLKRAADRLGFVIGPAEL